MNVDNRRPFLTQQAGVALAVMLACGALLGGAIVVGSWVYVLPAAAIFAIPFLAKWPVESSFGVYALLLPFDSIAALGEGMEGPTITRLFGIAAAAVLLLAASMDRRIVRPPQAAVWWGLFTLWGAISALWALDSAMVLERLPTSIGLFLVYLAAVSVRLTERELSNVCYLVIIGGAFAAAYSIYAYSQGIVFAETTGRASLIVGDRETDPNQFATTLLLPLTLAIGGAMNARSRLRRVMFIGALIVIATSLYLTMSRGTLVALIVILLTYLVRSGVNWRVWVPIAGIAIPTAAMPELFFERVSDIAIAVSSGEGRVDIWRVGLQALQRYWLIGAGLSNFPFAYNEYAGFAVTYQGYSRGSHNIFLGTWVELGIIGLALMLVALWLQLRPLWSGQLHWIEGAGGYLLSVESACYSILASGFFLDILWRKAFWLPWILLALLVRHGRQDERVES